MTWGTPSDVADATVIPTATINSWSLWRNVPHAELTASKATTTAVAVKPGSGDWTEVVDTWLEMSGNASVAGAGMHDPATNPTRVTVPAAATYLITAEADFLNPTGGTVRSLRLYLNGAEIDRDDRVPGSAAVKAKCRVSTTRKLAAGDYLEVELSQDSGGGITVPVRFAVTWQSL